MSIESIYLGLGSNLGDREKQLVGALDMLSESSGITLIHISSLFETEHIGLNNETAPSHFNCVCEIQTSLQPEVLLARIWHIEEALGLRRETKTRWGSRPIDIDILIFRDLIIQSPSLIVPHKELCNRRFVLEPLAELCPGVVVPGTNETVRALLARHEIQCQEVVKIAWNSGFARKRSSTASA